MDNNIAPTTTSFGSTSKSYLVNFKLNNIRAVKTEKDGTDNSHN